MPDFQYTFRLFKTYQLAHALILCFVFATGFFYPSRPCNLQDRWIDKTPLSDSSKKAIHSVSPFFSSPPNYLRHSLVNRIRLILFFFDSLLNHSQWQVWLFLSNNQSIIYLETDSRWPFSPLCSCVLETSDFSTLTYPYVDMAARFASSPSSTRTRFKPLCSRQYSPLKDSLYSPIRLKTKLS